MMAAVATAKTVVIIKAHPARICVVARLECITIMARSDAFVSVLTNCQVALCDAFLINVTRVGSRCARIVRNGVWHTIIRCVVVNAMRARLANVRLDAFVNIGTSGLASCLVDGASKAR